MDKGFFDYIVAQFGLAAAILALAGVAVWSILKEFAKLRTDLQQQAARDLLNRRFEAYSDLWKKLQPLAVYSDDRLKPESVRKLAEDLSSWYFSRNGGMFLTARARDFYFALQEMLEGAADLKGWALTRRPDNPKELFRKLLVSHDQGFDPGTLDVPEQMDHAQWHKRCKSLANLMKAWCESADEPLAHKVFACLQQVSSALRTVMTYELHSRLDANVPKP